MLLRYVLTNGLDYLCEIELLLAKLNFLNDYQSLFAFGFDGKCRAAARPERRMAALNRQLYVLRIMVATANHYQVFEAAGDEQLAVVQEAQIARPQKRPFARVR